MAFEKAQLNRVRARLELDFACDKEAGATFLADSLQEPPLKVVRAFPLADGTSLAHLHNVSGGLLGGDHLSVKVNAGEGTRVQLTTTSATRIYRSRAGAPATTQLNEITVGENALFEYVPDAIIPFAGSHFQQTIRIQLQAGAGLYWWEIVAPGREARGEIFAYENFEMRTRVFATDRIIAAENISLSPGRNDLASIARLGPYRYTATFYICAVGRDAAGWRAAEEHLRLLTNELTKTGESLWGVSTLVAHGLVVRCLARSGRDVLPGLHSIWKKAKLHLHGLEAIPPRKVN
jgi:urease accessory protein